MTDFTSAMNELIAICNARTAELQAILTPPEGSPLPPASNPRQIGFIVDELAYLAGMKSKYVAARDSGEFKLPNARFYEC